MFTRHALNPLITPRQVSPSRPDYAVIGTFNPGVTQMANQTILLMRVAERPLDQDPHWIACPYINAHGELALFRVGRDDPAYDTHDPRLIRQRVTGAVHLTSISHLRRASSGDGLHFDFDAHPWLQPEPPYETFGVEDARITRIDDRYYVNYSAVSAQGIATGLAETADFESVTRRGLIFLPSNRDVTLFPQPINGQYHCYHRPMPGEFGKFSIWMARSPDLIHWGQHRLVLEGNPDGWDSGRIGGGAPPVWTEAGWLSIYHAADRSNRYCLGLLLTAHDDPSRIITRSLRPIFEPESPYETSGFFPNVVFTCGLILQGDHLRLYYGASDETIALAEVNIRELLTPDEL